MHASSLKLILTLLSHLHLCLPSGLFPSGFQTNTPHCICFLSYMPHVPPISFYLMLSPEQRLVQHANDEAPPECNFLLYPVTSSSLALNTSLSTLHTCVISKLLHTVPFLFKNEFIYKIHLQVFHVISIVLYHSSPTFGQVLYCCHIAFVVDASDYSGHLIRHFLNASEAFPMERFLQFWEQVKGWWAHVRTVRQVEKHLPSILFQSFQYCT